MYSTLTSNKQTNNERYADTRVVDNPVYQGFWIDCVGFAAGECTAQHCGRE